MSVAECIKKKRTELELSQHEIEAHFGWGRGTVSNIERGIRVSSERINAVNNYLEDLKKKNRLPEPVLVETPKPVPKPEKEEDKFGPNKNHEGYSDPVASAALSNLKSKCSKPEIGEIWMCRLPSGSVIKKLVLSISDNNMQCVSVFHALKMEKKSHYDLYFSSVSRSTLKADLSFIDKLTPSSMERRIDVVSDDVLMSIRNQIFKNIGGVPQVKEIIKEVPVEVVKEVIKEVPVEEVKETQEELPVEEIIKECVDFEILKRERDFYKDAFERVCDSLGGKR